MQWYCINVSVLHGSNLTPPLPLPHTHLFFSGKLGPIVWLLGMTGIALATYFEYMEYEYKPAGTTWTIGQAALIWVLLAGLVGLVSAHFAVGSKRHLVRLA